MKNKPNASALRLLGSIAGFVAVACGAFMVDIVKLATTIVAFVFAYDLVRYLMFPTLPKLH